MFLYIYVYSFLLHMQQHIHIHNKEKFANGYINEGRLGPMPVSMYKNAFCSSMPLVINSIRNSEPQAPFYHCPKPVGLLVGPCLSAVHNHSGVCKDGSLRGA